MNLAEKMRMLSKCSIYKCLAGHLYDKMESEECPACNQIDKLGSKNVKEQLDNAINEITVLSHEVRGYRVREVALVAFMSHVSGIQMETINENHFILVQNVFEELAKDAAKSKEDSKKAWAMVTALSENQKGESNESGI